MDAVSAERATIDSAARGQTVTGRFLATVADHGPRVALRSRDGEGAWTELTWSDYADQASRAAGGLAGLGVGPGDRVALMLRNRAEFHVADMAALLLGATPFSIYNSSSPHQVRHLVSHAGAKVAVVDDAGVMARFGTGADRVADRVVLVEGEEHGAVPWAGLVGADPVDLAVSASKSSPDDLATLIYTSGTTGAPKAVMVSHANAVWTTESLLRRFGEPPGSLVGTRVVSYLPMAHIAERLVSHYTALTAGFEVSACPDPAQLAAHLREVRPEIVFGVPRVWEKVHAGVMAALASDPERAGRFAEALAAAGPVVAKRTMQGEHSLTEQEHNIVNFLEAVAFSPLRQQLGLDRCRYAVTGAAPIPASLIEWFRTVGVPMSEVYGMSENTGPLTWEPRRVRPGWAGTALPGVEVALAGDGEILARGGNVFRGYLDDPARTAEALDGDGWLHTGDLGELDGEGYLRIVDRKKELIVTAGGKNVSPANLEAALRCHPLVSQALVVGDRRPYVAALVVLDAEVAPGWAAQRGIEGGPADLVSHPEVRAELQRGVDEVNTRFSQAEQIRRFAVLGTEWLPDSEELTPTMKLKRRAVTAKYEAEIEALYRSAAG